MEEDLCKLPHEDQNMPVMKRNPDEMIAEILDIVRQLPYKVDEFAVSLIGQINSQYKDPRKNAGFKVSPGRPYYVRDGPLQSARDLRKIAETIKAATSGDNARNRKIDQDETPTP